MNIRERISQETKDAMKAHDELRVSVFRMLSSAMHNRVLEKRAKSGVESELSEGEGVAAIRSELKKRMDAIVAFRNGGRDEAADTEEREAEILRAFLPPELSDEDLLKLVEEGKIATGATREADAGKLTGWVIQRIGGQASGDRVMTIAKKTLGTT